MNSRRSLLGEKAIPRDAHRKHRAEQAADPSDTAKELVDRIGKEFVETAKTNRKKAWNDLNETVMLNLAVLASSRLLEPLRNIISTMAEVDRNILSAGGEGPKGGATLDEIAKRWTLDGQEASEDA